MYERKLSVCLVFHHRFREDSIDLTDDSLSYSKPSKQMHQCARIRTRFWVPICLGENRWLRVKLVALLCGIILVSIFFSEKILGFQRVFQRQ